MSPEHLVWCLMMMGLERHCAERLTAYKRPSRILILPELPRTPASKIDQIALRKHPVLASSEPRTHRKTPARSPNPVEKTSRASPRDTRPGLHRNATSPGSLDAVACPSPPWTRRRLLPGVRPGEGQHRGRTSRRTPRMVRQRDPAARRNVRPTGPTDGSDHLWLADLFDDTSRLTTAGRRSTRPSCC